MGYSRRISNIRCVLVSAYRTPLRFGCHLVAAASRVDGGPQLLQNRATVLLLQLTGGQRLHWMGSAK